MYESCLALRYEALVMRELNSVSDHQQHVSYEEWFTFAEHALENRFSVIARKAREKALGCFQMDDMFKTKDTDTLREPTEATRRINRLKDIAMAEVLLFVSASGIPKGLWAAAGSVVGGLVECLLGAGWWAGWGACGDVVGFCLFALCDSVGASLCCCFVV
ncbi:hypothetical protein Tco_0480503 [Tanacetum coccineum]